MKLTDAQQHVLFGFLGMTAKPPETVSRMGSHAWTLLGEGEKQHLREIYYALAPMTPDQKPIAERVRSRVAKQIEWMGLHGGPQGRAVSDRINGMSNDELLQIISEELSK